MPTRPPLPNSPLGEVVFEVRFPGDLTLPRAWGDIQKKLADEFPQLFVPVLNPGDAPALTPYRLSSADGAEMVTLSLNSMAFITRRYRTFDEFRARYVRILEAFTSSFVPPKLTRTGLRYVNWIPREFGSGAPADGRLHPALELRISGLKGVALQLKEPQVVLTTPVDGQSLRVALVPDPRAVQGVPQNRQNLASVLLDIDCYSEAERPVTDALGVLDDAHRIVDGAFFGMVTDAYLQYMRGEG
jgi:uncharacterized protein (TIGR04255 family)